MRIMIDTNVLISAFVLSSSYLTQMLEYIIEHHNIVLPTYIIDELKRITMLKFPQNSKLLELFLNEFPFELVYTPEVIDKTKYPEIRDIKDLPILVSAINEDVDVLITGDADFASVKTKHLEIMTPRDFVKKYG